MDSLLEELVPIDQALGQLRELYPSRDRKHAAIISLEKSDPKDPAFPLRGMIVDTLRENQPMVPSLQLLPGGTLRAIAALLGVSFVSGATGKSIRKAVCKRLDMWLLKKVPLKECTDEPFAPFPFAELPNLWDGSLGTFLADNPKHAEALLELFKEAKVEAMQTMASETIGSWICDAIKDKSWESIVKSVEKVAALRFRRASPSPSASSSERDDGESGTFTDLMGMKAWDECDLIPSYVFHGTPISKEDADRLFRVDAYGSVISFYACAGAPTGCEMDHIHPWILGGRTTQDNLQLLHHTANTAKGDRIPQFVRPGDLEGRVFQGTCHEFVRNLMVYGPYTMLGKMLSQFPIEATNLRSSLALLAHAVYW